MMKTELSTVEKVKNHLGRNASHKKVVDYILDSGLHDGCWEEQDFAADIIASYRIDWSYWRGYIEYRGFKFYE